MEDVYVTFTITRDAAANSGYGIAQISIRHEDTVVPSRVIVIRSVDSIGLASSAGMTTEHIGWSVVAVDGAQANKSQFDRTRNPNQTFSLTLQRMYDAGSPEESVLVKALME